VTGTCEPGTLYELLGVPCDAPAAEITRAYHRRARALHPDAQPGQAGGAGGTARFRELEAAYRVLHDPARRAAYDQALHQAAAAPPPASWPAAVAWPATRPLGRPAARPPGAALWAGPVQVTPPGAATPVPGTAGSWPGPLAGYPADDPGSALGWAWGWPW
jgi:curved DNA-binding protein CbpA